MRELVAGFANISKALIPNTWIASNAGFPKTPWKFCIAYKARWRIQAGSAGLARSEDGSAAGIHPFLWR